MEKIYDCIIVGAGPAGIYASYELIKKTKGLKILLVEKGADIYERGIAKNSTKLSKTFPDASITTGFGGSGAFSDGKFNITSEFGGWLSELLPDDVVSELINYCDNINITLGAPLDITDPTTLKVKEIEKKGIAVGLRLLKAKVRHLGTEVNFNILIKLFEILKENIDMLFHTEITDIIEESNECKGVKTSQNELIYGKNVFIACGREGSKWLTNICFNHNIPLTNNQVDIGVRVETNNIVMEDINENLYEGKFVFKASTNFLVRTFCSNPSGHVVIEDYPNMKLVNGHAYKDITLGTNNTNFAILVSHKFDSEFLHPNEYAYNIAHLANEMANNGIIVQRYGDFKKSQKTTKESLAIGFVTPSFKDACPSDLGLVLPYNTLKSIEEMIEALDHVTPGIANEHTLLYGVETKFYSSRPKIDNNFETCIKNLYVGGDGAGLTRGLAQAEANGIFVARVIIDKLKGE
jgi:uncharacterized FAD-dependent dehydrogenase